MTFSGSASAGCGGRLADRAFDAFDRLAGDAGAVGAAVSGGSDSTALLVLAAEWAGARAKRLLAATVDHGLRAEAREEAEAVGRLCAGFGVEHHILTWKRSDAAGGASQAHARRARHALLARWARGQGLDILALGHTRNDRIETFLMRARRGSGWHGLAGMMPSGPSPVWPEGKDLRLIRPILAFGRDELRCELEARGQCFMEDPSNSAERFERVRMRALVRRMDRAALAQALRVMDGLANMRAAVMAQARTALESLVFKTGEARVPISALAPLSAEARLRLVEALVLAAGGQETSPRREGLERILRLAEAPGATTLSGTWAKRSGDDLIFLPAPPRRGEPPRQPPHWGRAIALLTDPVLAALAV